MEKKVFNIIFFSIAVLMVAAPVVVAAQTPKQIENPVKTKNEKRTNKTNNKSKDSLYLGIGLGFLHNKTTLKNESSVYFSYGFSLLSQYIYKEQFVFSFSIDYFILDSMVFNGKSLSMKDRSQNYFPIMLLAGKQFYFFPNNPIRTIFSSGVVFHFSDYFKIRNEPMVNTRTFDILLPFQVGFTYDLKNYSFLLLADFSWNLTPGQTQIYSAVKMVNIHSRLMFMFLYKLLL